MLRATVINGKVVVYVVEDGVIGVILGKKWYFMPK